jgi:hypothetical protein
LSWQNWLNSPGAAPPVPPVEPDPPCVVLCGDVVVPPLLGVCVAGGVAWGVVVVVPEEGVDVLGVAPPLEVEVEVDVPAELLALVAVWSVVVEEVVPVVDVAPGPSASAPAGTVSGGAPGGMRSADCGLLPQPATATTASAANPAARARGARDGMTGA